MGRVSMPQGKGSQLHNRREYEKIGKPIPDNIDVSKSSENITLVDKDIKQAYQEIFGEALEKSERDGRAKDKQIADLQRENGSLRGQIRSLTAQLDEVKAELWNKINNLTDKLIDGLAEYGARWAKEDGFPEMAEEMEKRVGISKGIEKIIEPQAPKRSRGYEMEL